MSFLERKRALTFRELALVPFVAGISLAAWRRRWPEVAASVPALGMAGRDGPAGPTVAALEAR